jgi:signal transduction histidine kinase
MLRESCAAVARLARKADVTLERVIDAGICTVVSDEGKLRQVLYNFLAFAIHRSASGGRVLVEASSAGADEVTAAPQRFHIEITDDGEPLANPAHIFELFDTGPEPGAMPNDRGTDMNELGLVIAHRLVAILNGTVELSANEPQKGLRVRLTFPLLPATAHE